MYSKVTYENNVARKQVLIYSKKLFKNLEEAISNEIKFLNLFYQDSLDFNSPYIKVLKFLYRDNNTIVQEKVKGIEMIEYFFPIPRKIFEEAMAFFKFANSRGHYHRDVSEENLIYDEESKTLWIIDFGFALEKEDPEYTDIENIILLKESKTWM